MREDAPLGFPFNAGVSILFSSGGFGLYFLSLVEWPQAAVQSESQGH